VHREALVAAIGAGQVIMEEEVVVDTLVVQVVVLQQVELEAVILGDLLTQQAIMRQDAVMVQC
jgi:hypothetical protein